MKTLRLFLVAALAAAFLSPSPPLVEAQSSVLLPPVRTADAYMQRRAISKIGSVLGSAVNVAWLYDELLETSGSSSAPNGWTNQSTGTGTGSINLTDEGAGVHEITTGATAGGVALFLTTSPAVRALGTSIWYVAARQKITSAVTAQTIAYGGLRNNAANKTIGFGFFGALSAANFIVQYDGNEAGSFVNLGVAVDTSYHIVEVWVAGDSKLHCALDLGSADICAGVTMAAAPSDASQLIRSAKNGADNVARLTRTDWFAIMTKRN